jgi:hypothetical protein
MRGRAIDLLWMHITMTLSGRQKLATLNTRPNGINRSGLLPMVIDCLKGYYIGGVARKVK